MGGTVVTTIGQGRFPRLHLNDDWATWYDPKTQTIHVQFLPVAKRHFIIRLGRKHNPFFWPEVIMVDSENVLYTDVNDKGNSALLSYNLVSNNVTVLSKALLPGSRLEICSGDNYAALGEFPYPGAVLSSSISVMAWKVVPGLSGFTKIYQTTDADLGQMICDRQKVYFVKTTSFDRETNTRNTEAASIDIYSKKIDILTSLQRVTNLVNMDGRILLPLREEVYVLVGDPGTNQDQLQKPVAPNP
jgi:hypothetical protein